MGDSVILGGGGESTSSSGELDLDLDPSGDFERLLDRDLMRTTLRFEGESQTDGGVLC